MISNAIIPRFSATTPIDSNAVGNSGNFAQMLQLCNYTWNFGPGTPSGSASNYRVHVSWGTTGISQNVVWYFRISNVTQSVYYNGLTYSPNTFRYHTALTTTVGGTTYTAGSYMDIMSNVTISNGDTFQPLLYMTTASASDQAGNGSKFTFSMELAKEDF